MDLFTQAYKVNIERIKEAYPESRLLSKRRMADYLGLNDIRALNSFGIYGKMTRESFALRLASVELRADEQEEQSERSDE